MSLGLLSGSPKPHGENIPPLPTPKGRSIVKNVTTPAMSDKVWEWETDIKQKVCKSSSSQE